VRLPCGRARERELTHLEKPGRPADEREMLRQGVLAAFLSSLVVLTAVGSSGCFVLDELDAGQAFLDKTGSATKKKAETPVAEAQDGQKPHSSEAEWWKKARSLSSGNVDASIVRCQLHSASQFMRRSECEARGGHAG